MREADSEGLRAEGGWSGKAEDEGEPMAFLELNERFSCMHVEWHVSPI